MVHPADGVEVKVIAGELAGATGPVEGIATAPVYLDVSLQPGAEPDAGPAGRPSRLCLRVRGRVGAGRRRAVAAQRAGRAVRGRPLQLAGGDKASRLLVVAGRPLKESVARYGPFVMNTPEQIHEAIADFRAGKF